MNPDKTEAIVIGTNVRQRAQSSTSTLDLQTVSVKPTTYVRSLEVALIPRTLGLSNDFTLLSGWICLHGVLD